MIQVIFKLAPKLISKILSTTATPGRNIHFPASPHLLLEVSQSSPSLHIPKVGQSSPGPILFAGNQGALAITEGLVQPEHIHVVQALQHGDLNPLPLERSPYRGLDEMQKTIVCFCSHTNVLT